MALVSGKSSQNNVFTNILQNQITILFFSDPIKAWFRVIASLNDVLQ